MPCSDVGDDGQSAGFAAQLALLKPLNDRRSSGAALAYASLGTLLEPHRLFTQFAVISYAMDAWSGAGDTNAEGECCTSLHRGHATRLEGQSNHAATLGLWTLFKHKSNFLAIWRVLIRLDSLLRSLLILVTVHCG